MTYNEKLKELSLFSLEKQQRKGGTLRVFKRMLSFLNEDSDQLLSVLLAGQKEMGLIYEGKGFRLVVTKSF